MRRAIRLLVSIDHQKKKATTITLPFFLYLHFVTSSEFEVILPAALQERCLKLKIDFLAENQFFSDEYANEYERAPYIRFLTGPDVHKFFAKVLSLNYQAHKHMLQEQAGSFSEFFSDLNLFWNSKYQVDVGAGDEESLREALFCQACIQTQYVRLSEKNTLREKLGDFAKNELAAKEAEIKKLKRQLTKAKNDVMDTKAESLTLEARLQEAEEKNMVLVPSDPHYMLGLQPGHREAVEARAKALMKALHPDKSGTSDTAYLFDMVLKARDMIIK